MTSRTKPQPSCRRLLIRCSRASCPRHARNHKPNSLQLGLPRDDASLGRCLSGEEGSLMELHPELATLRDVTFRRMVEVAVLARP